MGEGVCFRGVQGPGWKPAQAGRGAQHLKLHVTTSSHPHACPNQANVITGQLAWSCCHMALPRPKRARPECEQPWTTSDRKTRQKSTRGTCERAKIEQFATSDQSSIAAASCHSLPRTHAPGVDRFGLEYRPFRAPQQDVGGREGQPGGRRDVHPRRDGGDGGDAQQCVGVVVVPLGWVRVGGYRVCSRASCWRLACHVRTP